MTADGSALSTALLGALTVVGVLLLALRGRIDGDRPDDAEVAVSLVPLRRPEGTEWHASVSISNRSSHPVVVLARARSRPAAAALWGLDGRLTPLLHRADLAGLELLGAVGSGATHGFLLPLRPGDGRTFRVSVTIEHQQGRTRRYGFTRTAGAGDRSQASSTPDMRAAPNERR